MKNPKKVGTDYERYVCNLINKILGSDFWLTKQSGGYVGGVSVDIWDKKKTTPLSRRSIEVKRHGSQKEFKRKIFDDLEQAINQAMAGHPWMLIEHYPGTSRELVIQDLEDYLVLDILSQMVAKSDELKEIFYKIEVALRELRNNFGKIKNRIK